MNPSPLAGVLAATLLLPLFPAPGLAQSYETPSVLKASEILEADWLKSDLHEIEPEVTLDNGLDRFVVRSAFGVEEVHGRELIRKRVREIHAAAALQEKRQGAAAVKGLANEVGDTAKTLAGALKKPVQTVFNIPKGMLSIGKRSVGSVENKAKAGGNYSGGPVSDWFQLGEAKLEMADKLGVDPYTDYEPLKKELERLGNTSALGGLVVRLVVPGDALLTTAEAGELTRELGNVYLTPPSQLYQENLGMLTQMGLTKERVEQFLASAVYSPADQSLMVRILAEIGTTEGLETCLDAAESAEDRTKSFLVRRSADLLSRHHKEGARFAALGGFSGFPVAVTEDRRLVMPLYVDRIYWTERAASVTAALQEAGRAADCSGVDLLVSGAVSERLRKELETRGFRILKISNP